MKLTKNKLKINGDAGAYFPTKPLRGGADAYLIVYLDKQGEEHQGHAFTDDELDRAANRFTKLDEGDANFPHRWTFLRWITGLISGRR
jgi:hypothetical protein